MHSFSAESSEVLIYAVTHEMMNGFQDNHRLILAEAETLFFNTLLAFQAPDYCGRLPNRVRLEEIVAPLGDKNTIMDLINHGPFLGFQCRRTIKSAIPKRVMQ